MGMLRKRVIVARNMDILCVCLLMAAFFIFHRIRKQWNVCPFFHQMLSFFLSLSVLIVRLHMCDGFVCMCMFRVCVCHHAIGMRIGSATNRNENLFDAIPHAYTHFAVCMGRWFFAPTKLSIEYPF